MRAAPTVECLTGLRAAILGNSAVTANLAPYMGSYAIFTRRPVPADAPYPMVIISEVTMTDEDGVNTIRPVCVVDLVVYGTQGAPNTSADHYRKVDAMARELRSMFHRQRPITVAGYSVTQITASGPSPAPADDDQHVGRRVTLTIRLFAN